MLDNVLFTNTHIIDTVVAWSVANIYVVQLVRNPVICIGLNIAVGRITSKSVPDIDLSL